MAGSWGKERGSEGYVFWRLGQVCIAPCEESMCSDPGWTQDHPVQRSWMDPANLDGPRFKSCIWHVDPGFLGKV